MLPLEMLDELAQKLSEAIPKELHNTPDELKKNVHSLLQGMFSKLNLVPADEFEVQSKVLARTREKVEQLTQQVTALEKIIKEKNEKE